MRFSANTKLARASKAPKKTVNAAGGEAFVQPLRVELVSLVLTSMLKGRFHQKDGDVPAVTKIVEQLAAAGDADFAAKAALYARHSHGLRSVSHVLAGEIGRLVKGADWTKRFFDKIVFRVDDACEILAYFCAQYGRKAIPNAMKRGLGKALARFDAYQIAKYSGGNRSLKLVDAVNLLHPPHTEALAALVKGTLASAETWENALSKAGKSAETNEEADVDSLKDEAWLKLFKERKVGYLACLRNLRNFADSAQSTALLAEASELLTDPRAVAKAKVFPFQFNKARQALTDAGSGRKALAIVSKACDLSLANVPRFDGSTLIAVDVSGSMSGDPIAIASIFAAALYRSNDEADIVLFDEYARYKDFDADMGVLSLADAIHKAATGGGTNFPSIFQTIKKPYKRVIILSDMQAWMGHNTPEVAFNEYKRRYSADPWVYSFDLKGDGTTQFVGNRAIALAGWSDKVFDLMKTAEQDRNVLVKTIEAVEL